MKTLVQAGETLSVTAPYAVASGAGVKVGGIIGVAQHDAAISEAVLIARRGVFTVGMTGVLADVFGAPVTISGSVAATVAGLFREAVMEQEGADGRVFFGVTPSVKLRKGTVAALVKGDVVAPSVAPGRSFTVLQAFPSGSPADDAFVVYALEEVR